VIRILVAGLAGLLVMTPAPAQRAAEPWVTPALPDGKAVATDTSDLFLKPTATLKPGVAIARMAPTIDFLFYPGQTYAGRPWSNWGDSLAANGMYYASIGDHHSANGPDKAHPGTARVFEYDPRTKTFRELVDLARLLALPAGHYLPGKIHGRLDLGSDGWLYFSTHRGSTTVTREQFHYRGDWIVRCDPRTGRAEVVAHGPVPGHCIPASVLDPERLIFYGGTAPGTGGDGEGVRFLAYDVKNKRVIHDGADGPARYMIHARSTGRVYYVPASLDGGESGPLVRFDPARPGAPVKLDASLGLRAATAETAGGKVFTVSKGGKGTAATLWAFDTKTETVEKLGDAAVGTQAYIASLDADAAGRYVYYVPGAHGGGEVDGSPVVQFDTKTRTRKVIAFLHPFYKDRFGCTLQGTFSTALDPAGDKLYVTWNVSRGGRVWDCCALTVIHIPESERAP
jgi:hypothetical protein